MRNKYLVGLSMIFVLALASPALAQDADTATTEDTALEAAVETAAADQAVEEVISESGLSAEALQDETITEADLGAQTPGRFHFLTKFKRTVQRTVTRDPVKKAEFRIEEAHEELLRAKKLADENPDDTGAQNKVQNALSDFERNIEKVKDHANDIKTNRPDQAGDFLEKIADFQIKQQKMLDNLEEKLPEQAFAKVKEARIRAMQHQGEVMTAVAQNQDEIAERFNAALSKQRGSDFKEFKNIEMLERFEQFVPEETRGAIERTKVEARLRFEQKMQELPEAARDVAFSRYVANIAGDPIQQMRALDDIKSNVNLSDGFFDHIEDAKEKTINKFEERYRRFSDPTNREAFLDELGDGNPDNLRVIQQIRENVPQEIRQEIERKEEQSIQRFKERFIDDPDAQSRANKFQELARKMRENPDPATFAAIQKLEQTLPPEQRAFVDSLEQEARAGFEERFDQERDVFLKRIESFDPSAIGHLQDFAGGAPPEFQGFIQQAVNGQIDFTQQRLQQFDDPARFERFKQQIDQNDGIRQQIEARYTGFSNQLENKNQEIQGIKQQIEQTFNARIEQEKRIRAEQGRADFTPQELDNIKERFLLRPQLGVERDVEEQFRRSQEEHIQRQFQNQARDRALEQGFQGDDLKKFLESQGINERAQRQFEQQRPPDQVLQNFQNLNPEIQQKLQEQSRLRADELRERVQRGDVPDSVRTRIQQPVPPQSDQRGTPSPTGEQRRFDPRSFLPGDRGDVRRDEVRQQDAQRATDFERDQQQNRVQDQRPENRPPETSHNNQQPPQEFRSDTRVQDNNIEFRRQEEFQDRETRIREEIRTDSGSIRQEFRQDTQPTTDSRPQESTFRPDQNFIQQPSDFQPDSRPPENTDQQKPPEQTSSSGSTSQPPPPPPDNTSGGNPPPPPPPSSGSTESPPPPPQ